MDKLKRGNATKIAFKCQSNTGFTLADISRKKMPGNLKQSKKKISFTLALEIGRGTFFFQGKQKYLKIFLAPALISRYAAGGNKPKPNQENKMKQDSIYSVSGEFLFKGTLQQAMAVANFARRPLYFGDTLINPI